MSSYYDDTPTLYTVEDEEPETIKVDPREFNGKISITREEMVQFFSKKVFSAEKIRREVDKEFDARAPRYNGKGGKLPSAWEARQAESARTNYYSEGYSRSDYRADSPPRGGYASDDYSHRVSVGSSPRRSPSPPRSHYERPSYGKYDHPESSGRSRGSPYRRSSSPPPPPPPPHAPSPRPAANYSRDEVHSRRRERRPSYGEQISPPRSPTHYESSHRSSRRDPSPPRHAPNSAIRGRRPSYDEYGRPHIRHISLGPGTRTHRRRDGSIVVEVEEEPRRSSVKNPFS